MNEQLADKIRSASNLPSLPAIAIQVLDLTQKPEVDLAQIARVISRDPALTGKILRTVNSSFYGRANNIGTISHALVILGLQSVKTLVLGFSLVNLLSKTTSSGFRHVDYWRRSIYGATAARALAARVNLPQQEEAFLAALLADIGMLVLDQVLAPDYDQVCETATDHLALVSAEHAALGATHAEAGGLLAEIWKLPAMLAVPIAQHHSPEAVTDPALRKLSELVGLAGRCADVFVEAQPALAIADVRKQCLDRHGLSEADCDALLDDIGKRTREVAGLFEIHIGSAAEYESILKRANQALVELTVQAQQHASQLVQQATTLQQRNQQLQRQASTDALTGLANRARFDEFLAEQLAAAVKTPSSGRGVALLLIDVDRFKRVNDTLGHPAGDAVLRAIGRILQEAARNEDLAARYGGDELVLVRVGTTRADAATLAETLRRTLAARPIPAGKTAVPVTASIGVAVCEPGSPFQTPAHLIKAADLAVYNAKHCGRNRVKILVLRSADATASSAAADPDEAAAPTTPIAAGAPDASTIASRVKSASAA